MKRITAICLALVLAFGLGTAAFAAGFNEVGGYTDTEPLRFTFETGEAVMVYNKSVDKDPDLSHIYTGSVLYIPIYVEDEDKGTENIVSTKQMKDNEIKVLHTATSGARYIADVSVVDGKKEKVDGIGSGAYARVEFSDNYTGTTSTHISMKLVLSVNKVSYQETRIGIEGELENRLEYIDDNSAYGAQVPTRFRVSDYYSGEATFDMGDGIRYTARVTRNTRYTIDFTRDPDYDIDLMYPDAYLEFYNFRGNNDTFASVGKLTIPINTGKFKEKGSNQTRVYAYEVLAGNQLQALGSDKASYDSQKQELTISTQTLGHYVLSNQKLKQDVETGDDGTFQSGYDTDEELSQAEEATDVTPSGQSSGGSASQSAAGTQASQASEVSGTTAPEPAPAVISNDDWSARDVPNTGGVISAANTSANNPNTSLYCCGAPLIPVAILGGITGIVAWLTRPRRKKEQ